MPQCTNCGAQNPVSNEWCTNCSARLPLSTGMGNASGGARRAASGYAAPQTERQESVGMPSGGSSSGFSSPEYGASVSAIGNFFTFRMMVTPIVIRVIYVLGALLVTITGIVLLVQAGSSQTCTTDFNGNSFCSGTPGAAYVITGLGVLTLGNLLWRVLCEQAIIFFSIHDRLRSMDDRLGSTTQSSR